MDKIIVIVTIGIFLLGSLYWSISYENLSINREAILESPEDSEFIEDNFLSNND